jgi:Asp-tRNA(Asn)/Glu-tRNA(Gln) amidotransferase A subunit family amidase
VALATGMVPLATGSDYGGSLRTPSSYCGVVGFRPSPGLVPSADKAAALTPWGVLGPMGRSIADAHLLLQAQIDYDKRDPFSGDDYMRIPDALTGIDLSSVRVAVSTDLGCAPVDKRIAADFEKKVASFRHVFAEAQDRDPELGPGIHEVFEILRELAFATSHAEKLKTAPDKLGPNVRFHTEAAMKRSLPEVAWAQVEQGRIMKRYLSLFDEVDVLIAPAVASSPFPHTQWFPKTINGEEMPTYMRWLAICYGLTMALPVVACIPCGLDHAGMPFGIQVAGPNGSDAIVLEIAHALEQELARNPETARPSPDLAKLTTGKKPKAMA